MREKTYHIYLNEEERSRVIVSSKNVGNLLANKQPADNTAFAIRQSRQMNTTY